MKKRGLAFGILFLVLIVIPSALVLAQESDSCETDNDCDSNYICVDGQCELQDTGTGSDSSATSNTDQAKIDKAYDWLEGRVANNQCESLTLEEQIFTLLAIKECEEEVISAGSGECWPAGNCDIKTTSLAVLALDKVNEDTDQAQEWLLSQNTTPTDLIWYLEIDSDSATTCTINYGGGAGYTISIGEDKKISGSTGACLTPAVNDYWLRISTSCYDQSFSISCDKSFLTTLLYQKQGSSTFFVSEKVSDAPAEASTTEIINSNCFKQGNACTYEGSLWAARVLDSVGKPVSSFIPYLIASKSDFSEFLPDSFLYSLTGQIDFRTSLLGEQVSTQYWDESGDKFYDTAVAMFSLSKENIQETNGAKQWLLLTQDADDGSWRRNVRNTAFILASVFPKQISIGGVDPSLDCEDANYFCVSGSNTCLNSGGTVRDSYSCSVGRTCCTIQEQLQTCSELNGVICPSGQECSISSGVVPSSDLGECCVGGICQPIAQVQETECKTLGDGNCYSSCNPETEDERSEFQCDFGICCTLKEKEPTTEGIPWWIWLLIVLIILALLGIIFRKKIREFRFRKTKSTPSGFLGQTRGLPPPGLMPARVGSPPARPLQRRILPPGAGATRMPPRPQKKDEIEDVLKKLREMGEKKNR